MARNNSVPLGRAGTGAAYILGESDAANQLLHNIDQNRQVRLQNEQLKSQYAQQLANDWRQNQLKIKGGTLWENDLQKKAAEVIELGTKLRQMNVNPYRPNPNDPLQMQASEMFLSKKREVEAKADYRDTVQKALQGQHEAYQKEIPGTFEQDDVALINNFPSQYSLDDAYGQGIQAPMMRKAFQESDFLGKIKPTPITEKKVLNGIETSDTVADMPSTRQVVLSNYISSPQAKAHIQKEIGVAVEDLPMFNPILPDTSDFNELKEANDKIYRSPKFMDALAYQGIKSYDSQEYDTFLNKVSRSQSEAQKKFNNYIDDKTKEVAAKQGIKHDRGYNFELEREMGRRRKAQLAEQKAAGDGGVSSPRNVSIPYSDGKANVNVKNFIGLSIPAKNFAGSPAYNMSTGERIPALESSSDYEVVGVGNFPFINANVTDSNGKNLNGTLAQPGYQDRATEGSIKDQPMVHVQQKKDEGGIKIINDYLVPYDRLPDNVKNTKSVREALGKFKPASSAQKTKSISMADVLKSYNGDPDYRKQYTKQEFIDWYKKQGYIVK